MEHFGNGFATIFYLMFAANYVFVLYRLQGADGAVVYENVLPPFMQ